MQKSPNPNWKPGDKIESPVSEMITIDTKTTPPRDIYRLMIGTIVPRPIAFVSTISKSGVGNLAPFSFFNGVSSNPPCLMLSVSKKDNGDKKDTLRNIEETEEFVVNIANEWLVEALVHCAAKYPYGVNEMEKVGLTPIPSSNVKPPRVRESSVQFECKLYKLVHIGEEGVGSSTVVIGKIVSVHVDKNAYKDGKVLLERIKPVARLGGISYASLGEPFSIPVPEVE